MTEQKLEKNHLYELTDFEKESFEKIAKEYGTPAYVYFENRILKQIEEIKKYNSPYGLTVRFAVKANPNLSILKLMENNGIWFDASTLNEAYRVLDAGVSPEKILITSQQFPEEDQLVELVNKGVQYNATSLWQLELYGKNFPDSDISIRFNIGMGSGWNPSNTTGGINSSFGIYDKFDEIDEILKKYNLSLKRVHIHIGSGADPKEQTKALIEALKIVEKYPQVKKLDMGGGFKWARVDGEKRTDVNILSKDGENILKDFYEKTGRKIALEIEPGTFLAATVGFILSEVRDIANTGEKGMSFVKLNTGANDNTRVALYGSQHPIFHIKNNEKRAEKKGSEEFNKHVLVGECCESSDILTCLPNQPATQREEEFDDLREKDLIIVGETGAYCAGMSFGNYNSKERSAEFLVRQNGDVVKIREAEKRRDVWKNDILIDF